MNAHSRRAFLGMGAAMVGFLVTPGIGAATAGTRILNIDGVSNFRDIGGYTTSDGKTVKWSTVYRSGSLATVTDSGLSALGALGLKLVVDFRTTDERKSTGTDKIPPGVAEMYAPVGDENAVRRAAAAPDPDTIAEYRSYVSNSASRTSFAKTLGAVRTGNTLPMLYHCNAGASRTGWATAVLLTVLGVPQEQIYQDFLLTNQVLGGEYLFPDYLDAAFDQANRSFGSFSAFAANGLGLNAAAISDLKARMLQ